MQPLDHIESSRRQLAAGQRGKPRQSDLKRASSTAYYAMFHALCRNCADSFIGKTRSQRSQRAWIQVYRAVNHGHAGQQCKNLGMMKKFPRGIEDFAILFTTLQERRHQADYDISRTFTRNDVLMAINSAEVAINKLTASNIKDQRAFAAWTAMPKRPN